MNVLCRDKNTSNTENFPMRFWLHTLVYEGKMKALKKNGAIICFNKELFLNQRALRC